MYNISLLLPLFDVYVTGERLDYRLLTKAISTSWGVTFTFSPSLIKVGLRDVFFMRKFLLPLLCLNHVQGISDCITHYTPGLDICGQTYDI